MRFAKLLDVVKKTDSIEEMIEIGKAITVKCSDVYTPLMLEKLYESVNRHIPEASNEKKTEMLYRSIYDYWVYGCNTDEEFYLHFETKDDAEKREYLCDCIRDKYFDHLNSGGGKAISNILSDKYFLYQRLKPYYLREMIEVKDESDYSSFESFTKAHEQFVVKPLNLRAGIGVHKASLQDYNNDVRTAFDRILGEAATIHGRYSAREAKMVLEELIDQDPLLAALHPDSVNAVRATAVRGKDGKIHLYHPWIRIGVNGMFVVSGIKGAVSAEIDPGTGVVITDGYQENGNIISVLPDCGIRLKGFQIPRWTELVALVDELMDQMPEFGYIGWDLVLTPKGWCVMEGNYWGGFLFQMINGRGCRKEFEDLIGWKYNKEFWWMEDPKN